MTSADGVGVEVTVTVFSERCMASGICREIAPAVFGADSEGWVELLDAAPSPELVGVVLEAVKRCPTVAIEVESRQTPTEG